MSLQKTSVLPQIRVSSSYIKASFFSWHLWPIQSFASSLPAPCSGHATFSIDIWMGTHVQQEFPPPSPLLCWMRAGPGRKDPAVPPSCCHFVSSASLMTPLRTSFQPLFSQYLRAKTSAKGCFSWHEQSIFLPCFLYKSHYSAFWGALFLFSCSIILCCSSYKKIWIWFKIVIMLWSSKCLVSVALVKPVGVRCAL